MKVINVIRDKMKLKLIETGFCLGVGLDQLTPVDTKVVFTHFVGYVTTKLKPVDTASMHTKPVNTDSKYKPNYSKRVSFKK